MVVCRGKVHQYCNTADFNHCRVPHYTAVGVTTMLLSLLVIIERALSVHRNASVRIKGSPEDTDLLANAGQDYEEEARRMARFALKMLKRDVAEDEASGDTDTGLRDAECTNPECQWVHNTDVQNK